MNAGSSSVMGGGGGGRGRKWRVPEDDTLQIVDPKRGKGKVGNPVSYNLFILICTQIHQAFESHNKC